MHKLCIAASAKHTLAFEAQSAIMDQPIAVDGRAAPSVVYQRSVIDA